MVAPQFLLVDKPSGMTSHDVVARVRRAAGTRKVGHAGTLDPMATGLLMIGIEGATRLLHYCVGLDKVYTATIRLGATSSTDDADGEVGPTAPAAALDAIDEAAIDAGIAALTGPIEQVPSSVSAIKVDGKRAYDRVREGEEVVLKARAVRILRFERHGALRRSEQGIDLDVEVECSSGTYIRALARDLGAALGVGGYLTVLRRTSVGPFRVDEAASLDEPLARPLTPAEAASALFPTVRLGQHEAIALGHGKRLTGLDLPQQRLEPVAALDESGHLLGLISWNGERSRVLMNMPTVTEGQS